MSVADADVGMKTPRKKRSIWRWLLWAFLVVLLLIALAAAIVWSNRYAILESAAEDLLLEQGIEAELSIQSITKTQAVLKTIRFSDGTSEFFSADKIIADYAWREALKGRVDKLQLIRPKARLTLDDKGRIIDGWLPPAAENEGGETVLPPEGIIIQDGLFSIGSPFGEAEIKLEATIFEATRFKAIADIAPTTFSYGDWRMAGGGQVDIDMLSGNPLLDVDVRLTALEHPVIDAAGLHMQGQFVPEFSDKEITLKGKLSFEYESLFTAQLTSGAGKATWDGDIGRYANRQHPLEMRGEWASQTEDVVLPDPIRRQDLAETLSLSETLLNAPIAQNFSTELTQKIVGLLTRSDIEAAGSIDLKPSGLAVSLSGPAFMRGDKTALRMEQTDWAPVYNFSRADEALRLAFHAALTEPAGLTFREADLVAPTQNGWQLDGIERFSADISTSKSWRSKGLEGRGARLAPFKTEAVYKGGDGPRNLLLSGGVDYDGTIPGGYASGLKTAGRMTMDLRGNAMSVRFDPEGGAPIRIAKLDTDTEWRGEDISATLNSQTPIFIRRGDSSEMTAKLANVSLIAIDETNTKNLGMTFEAMEVSGTLKSDKQSWDILGKTVQITSEDMPGPGTVITTPEARIQVERAGTQAPIQFFMAAPVANAKTQLVNAAAIRIEAAGEPDKYVLRYSPGESGKGRVKFTGDAIPRLPMTGLVNYADGAFEGTATTTLPLADDTPIDIAYRFKDGQGTADVNIPELRFVPKGLQPQYLVSALRGKIAEVEGLVQANIRLAFAAGQPLQSSGTAKIIDMNFGTLPGPLSGVNTEMSFSNMFPLQSQGRQTLTVDKFDPGFPLENGTIEFEMIPDGVKVYSARWPLGDGFFSLDPFEWLYSNKVNRVVMRIENVSIGEFLKDVGDGALNATGDIEGTLPIVLSGIDVKVENGELFVRDGGRIQYQSKQLNSISQLDGTDERAVKAMRQGNYRDAAFEALKDFEYDELRVSIDGPLDGAMGVFLKFDGKNGEVLGGQPFRFNVGLEGELLNILRSFNTNAQIKGELARRGLAKEEEIPDLEQ